MTDTAAGRHSGRELLRRLRAVDASTLLEFFTERQYVKPRSTVMEMLDEADERLGVCPLMARRAVDWLELDGKGSIGRLRRTELTQLSRCLHRFLRHASSGSAESTDQVEGSSQVKRACRL